MPPPKKRKVHKVRARSSRLASLSLGGSSTPGRKMDRNTIGWATPNTMAKALEEEALAAVQEEDDEEDVFDEEDEEDDVRIQVSDTSKTNVCEGLWQNKIGVVYLTPKKKINFLHKVICVCICNRASSNSCVATFAHVFSCSGTGGVD